MLKSSAMLLVCVVTQGLAVSTARISTYKPLSFPGNASKRLFVA